MSAAYQKARRDAARAKGLCGQCCKRPAENGFFRCTECRMQVNGKSDARTHRLAVPMARRSFLGWCGECIAAGFHRIGCSR
jgi:hypothetical protein